LMQLSQLSFPVSPFLYLDQETAQQKFNNIKMCLHT
jgi:hypothetical protein